VFEVCCPALHLVVVVLSLYQESFVQKTLLVNGQPSQVGAWMLLTHQLPVCHNFTHRRLACCHMLVRWEIFTETAAHLKRSTHVHALPTFSVMCLS
jgi:hypothetical protein